MSESQQCPNCGMPNPPGNALCSNCKLPLTAYAGQIDGVAFDGTLKSKVGLVAQRPVIVPIAVLLQVLYTLITPIYGVIYDFTTRVATNSEGTNYLAAALGTIGPIMKAILLVPIAAAIIVVAVLTWLQRTQAWGASTVVLAVIILTNLNGRPLSVLMILVAIPVMVIWQLPRTKAWFGI